MATAAQRIAELERQVAELAAEMQDLRAEAFASRAFEEIRTSALSAGRAPAAPPRRTRHLHAVGAR
jgi:hypothetical protein